MPGEVPTFRTGATAEDVTRGLDVTGRTFLVTGANSGIGLETARVLALRGGRVVAVARTEEKARDALSSVGASGVPVAMDLAEPSSVRQGAGRIRREVDRLDAMVANAGIMAPAKLTTRHGYELQFLTNHLGHHLLVRELLERLAEDGRVVVVSSRAHRRAPAGGIEFDNLSGAESYSPFRAYGQSKLANILFARALSRRLPHPRQTSNSLHPGVIETAIWRHLNPVVRRLLGAAGRAFRLLDTIPQGAATQTYLAAHPEGARYNGMYLVSCAPAKPSRYGSDDALAERLWVESERILDALG